ncbi:MAG: hypothetical protein ACE37F_20390 [Nannocystaceae bacterium]|nr:hypothetical protein [bacterium]
MRVLHFMLPLWGLALGCGEPVDAPQTLQGSSGAEAESSGGETGTGTGGPADPVNLDVATYPLETLSAYGFFVGPLREQVPNAGVVGFTVAAPLWADAADKGRFFAIPQGATIEFSEQGAWSFPVGSVLIKTFAFDLDRGEAEDLRYVETRLLVHEAAGRWQGYVYVWNDAQTEAVRSRAGADVVLDYVDASGQPGSQLYLVPDENLCETCHRHDDQTVILGPTTRQMNTRWAMGGEEAALQIDWLAEQGYFAREVPAAAQLPALVDPAGDAPIDARARSYLHGNCAHCHREGGLAEGTGLRLSAWIDVPAQYGVCKKPGALAPSSGGARYDIWPGHPEQSFVPFRMASTDPAVKMPEVPNLLADAFGVELIEDWIAQLPGDPCE